MGHKDKGRKGDKGKGKKRDRAKNATAPEAAQKVEAAPAPKVARSRSSATKVATRPVAARPVAAGRVPAPRAEAPKVDRPPLPTDRPSLLALHQAARRQRDAAPLLSRERADATFEIERIEVQVARVERAMDPPLV